MTTHQTPSPPRLRLKLPAGSIDVTTWDEPRTEVDVEPVGSDSESADAAAAVRQDLRTAGSGLELLIEPGGRRGLFGIRGHEPELRYVIRAPHGSSLHASTASADVAGHGRFQAVQVETASGDVTVDVAADAVTIKSVSGDARIDHAGGELRINSVSGDLTVGTTGGDVTFTTVSGDARIGTAAASVFAKSVSGDVHLESVSRGEVAMQSVSGDITIGVVRGATLWMDVGTLSGDMRSELDPLDGGGQEGRAVDLRLKASTTSGDIRLMRAEPAAV